MSSYENHTRLQVLLAEQAALRRVATLVAGSTPAPALFAQVCHELGMLLAVKTTDKGYCVIVTNAQADQPVRYDSVRGAVLPDGSAGEGACVGS